MFGVTTADDYEPVAYVGRYPLHVTALLVVVHSIAAIAACFLFAFGGSGVLNALLFDSRDLWSGALWQVVTYAFVHPPSGLLWFAIEMYMLFIFGREVEKFVGRRAFITLYAVLLLAPPVLLTLWGLVQPVGLGGSSLLHFAVFCAFATIYPTVEMFLRIQVRWIALALGAILTLQLFAGHDWPRLAVLWFSIAVAFLFIRSRGAGAEMEWWSNFKARLQPKPKFKVVPRDKPRRVVEPEDVYDSIDPLLDKISKHGINSLTPSERRALDRARAQLLKKGQ